MELREYMNKTFPRIDLKPNLYQQWDKSIHFELAKGLYPFKHDTAKLDPAYFHTVYNQAETIFNALFAPADEIIVVTNIYQYKSFNRTSRKKTKVYHRYVKNRRLLLHLKQEMLPYPFEDETDYAEKCTTQFSLNCRKQNVYTSLLIKTMSHQDFTTLKPRLHNPYGLYEPDVFFVKTTRNVIFHMYDDRGCEVIAENVIVIQSLFDKYGDWVDEEYEEEIEGT